MATRYGLDGPVIESRSGRDFSPFQTGPEAHLASYSMGIATFLGVQRPGYGVNHSTLLIPNLKKE